MLTAVVVKKNTVEISETGRRIEVSLPKKIKSGEKVLLQQNEMNEFSFVSLIEKPAEEAHQESGKVVENSSGFKFVNFFCGCTFILDRNGKMYNQLREKGLTHLNLEKEFCPDCGSRPINMSEFFKKNKTLEDIISERLEVSSKKARKNKTVFFDNGNFAWVNKFSEHYDEFNEEITYPWLDVEFLNDSFFKIFDVDGKQIYP